MLVAGTLAWKHNPIPLEEGSPSNRQVGNEGVTIVDFRENRSMWDSGGKGRKH